MYFLNNYITFSENLLITSISSYKNIITNFTNKFIIIYNDKYHQNKDDLYVDALLYSKYYLNYKTLNCLYDDDVMEILLNVDRTNI
jgi:hypothetical protein